MTGWERGGAKHVADLVELIGDIETQGIDHLSIDSAGDVRLTGLRKRTMRRLNAIC